MTVIGEIAASIRILETIKKAWTWRRHNKNKTPESIAVRFIKIFEAHGIHRNQIPRFFGHGLTVKDVQSDESLIARLDEDVLSDACSMFAIRRQWLDGAEAQAYPLHHFYKDLNHCAELITQLKSRNSGPIDGLLLMSDALEGDGPALLLFSEIIGSIDDKEIYRHHLCPFDAASYWRSRGYIAASVSMAWKHAIYVRGRRTSSKHIESYARGTELLVMDGPMAPEFSGSLWYPEDMALLPEVYLKGVDPERDNFGLRAALGFWLELEAEGEMRPIEGKAARPLFERELAKYTKAKLPNSNSL